MNWPEECAAIVPCFNEAADVGAVVKAVHTYLPTVLVVDDGSEDPTGTAAVGAGARVLRHSENQGKGAALKTGFQEAMRLGFSWALMLDGDGQHAASDIPLFWYAVELKQALLVVGNRMSNSASIPTVRRYVNHWMSRKLSQRAGLDFPDSQCGFRLLHLPTLASLTLQTLHFEIESEMLLAFAQTGQRIEFVPIQMLNKKRPSKIHPIVDTWRWFKWWSSKP